MPGQSPPEERIPILITKKIIGKDMEINGRMPMFAGD
jgi:hypothetical protein